MSNGYNLQVGVQQVPQRAHIIEECPLPLAALQHPPVPRSQPEVTCLHQAASTSYLSSVSKGLVHDQGSMLTRMAFAGYPVPEPQITSE